MSEKFAASDDDTKNCIFEYVNTMNKYASMFNLYKGIPLKMMTKLTNIAGNLQRDIENGNQKIDLIGLGKTVASSIDASDLQEFSNNMVNNFSNVQSLCQNMIHEATNNSTDSNPDSILGNIGGSLSTMLGMLNTIMPKK